MRTGSPLGRPSALAPQTTGDWLITPADKARFDVLYAELDKTNKGFITGEEAVPFFSQSNLPEDTLAQIWDLADFRSEGRLNKDQFAVAMYLIRQQRTRKDGPNLLPTALPLNLIPPSMRNQVQPPAATASPFDAPPPAAAPTRPAVPPPKPSHLDDLFGLDSPQPSAPTQVPAATGASITGNDPFSTSSSPPPPLSPIGPSTTGTQFKPFVPSSSFGRNLLPQGTGGSNSSAPAAAPRTQPQPAAVEDDLLGGENDTDISNKLNNETTELANLSNQVGSLSKQMHDVQGKRSSMQSELDQITAQKKNFEQRLAQLRSTYEKEAQDVRALETQLTAARNDTKKLQTEMAMLDGTYHDLQNQHAQVLAALQADQQENAALKERIRAVNDEIAQLKPQIEKLKSDARQQKGLVAINKKQLVTNEGEKDRLKAEAEDLARSNDEMARQVGSSSPPPAQIASPTLSTTSGNNPFFRRTGSTDIVGTFASPNLKAFHDKSFDDVFGPSPFPTAGQASTPPPPPATFRPQNTGTSTASFTSGSFATPTSTALNMSRQGTLATEPPAPPESRQLSSSYLPFAAENQESVTSSRQVSPPLSRISQADTGSADARSSPLASPAEITRSDPSTTTDGSDSETAKDSADSQPSQEGQTSHETGTSNSSWWGTKDKEGGEGVIASATAAVSHAAEGVLHAATGVKDNLFGSSDPDSSSKSPPVADETLDHFPEVDQAKAKEDFDSAFASFKSARAKAPAADTPAPKSSTSQSEFPPVSSLEIEDDESDSDSDRGFDDDFAPASPPPKSADKSTEASKPSSPVASRSVPVESPASPNARVAAPVPAAEQLSNTTRYEA
jgi:epidermal growth factor receptor substrate 15